MIIDEEGSLRITGKNQTDHNTLLMNMKINNPRKPTYRETWKLNNREGWKEFNQEMKKKKPSVETQYNEIESKILDTMEKTVGKVKILTDKEKKILSEKAKQTKKTKKEAKETFQEACKKGDPTEKAKAKENYIRAQMEYRKEIEETEREQIERRIKKLTEKAKIDPNTIWKTRKRTNRPNEIEYNTITEEGETITDPRKAKEYIANYFENLYQARPGTEDYQECTEHIADTIKKSMQEVTKGLDKDEFGSITMKELNRAIRKLKRKKSLGPDNIPNEIFIESSVETRRIYLDIMNRIHSKEEIPPTWLNGHIIRLYKGKGTKGKCSNERGITLASNMGKIYERIVNERVKRQVYITEAQAGGTPGNATVDHLITLKQTISEIRKKGKTAYIVFLDVQKAYDKAWLDAILYALKKNGVGAKNLKMVKKLNSDLTATIQTRYGLTREIKIRDSIRQGGVLSVIEYATLIDEIATELRENELGITTETGHILESLLWMDDVCLVHYDFAKLQKILNITNHVARKYHVEFGAAKCKVVKIGKGITSQLRLNG